MPQGWFHESPTCLPRAGRGLLPCRVRGRTGLGPAARRQCFHPDPERIAATVAAVVGLIDPVIGGLALVRCAGRRRRSRESDRSRGCGPRSCHISDVSFVSTMTDREGGV